MEPLVRLVVAGGVGMVGGLWAAVITPSGSALWIGGVVFAAAGTAAIAAGIRRELVV